jgi:hypothetical protein
MGGMSVRMILATLTALCLVAPTWGAHGGGGGHGGGSGHGGLGHVGGGRAHSGHRSLLDHFHHQGAFRTCESFQSACGGAYGVVDCGFLAWRCRKTKPVTTVPAKTSTTPLQTDSRTSEDSPSSSMPVIWLKGGHGYELADYWVQDGLFHYRTSYGGENSVLPEMRYQQIRKSNSPAAYKTERRIRCSFKVTTLLPITT